MKKTVLVTTTKEIEVDIPDEMLTKEYLEDFSSYMFHVESPEDIFQYAASHAARFHSASVEGLGRVEYSVLFEDIETEIVA